MKKLFASGILYLFIHHFGIANQLNIDSLKRIYSQRPLHDSVALKTAINLGDYYISNDIDSSMYYAEKAKKILKKSSYLKYKILLNNLYAGIMKGRGEIDSALQYYFIVDSLLKGSKDPLRSENLLNISYVYATYLSNYSAAKKYINAAKQIATRNKDNYHLARSSMLMGIVYMQEEDYENALKFTLEYRDSVKNTNSLKELFTAQNNIAAIYSKIGDHKLALSFFLKNIEVSKVLNDNAIMATTYMNIAVCYSQLKNYKEAIKYHEKAFVINQILGSKVNLLTISNNLSRLYLDVYNSVQNEPQIKTDINVYNNKNLLDSSYYYAQKSLVLAKELNDKKSVANSLLKIGKYEELAFNYQKAIKHYFESLEHAKSAKSLQLQSYAIAHIIEGFKLNGEYKKALEWYDKYTMINDSIYVLEAERETAKLQGKYESDLKIEELEKNHAIEIAIEKEKQKRQVLYNYIVFGGLVIALFIALFVINRLKITRKQRNLIITQKQLLEEERKKMMQSITYAEKIQSSILPNPLEIRNHLKNFMVYYKPRDIVSGDFYWFVNTPENSFLALSDCTGHGVPGAFMSMIGTTLLNDIVLGKKITSPGDILEELDLGIQELLKQNDYNATQDGMEIAIIKFNKKNGEITFASANQHLFLTNGDQVERIKGNLRSIGGILRRGRKKPPFLNQIIPKSSANSLFLCSDGFVDQFGGEEGKKYGINRFTELLIKIQNEPFNKQSSMIDKTFENWKGESKQIDDVCVIGFKL